MIYFILILGMAGTGLLLYMLYEAFQNNVVEESVRFAEFPANMKALRLFFISDIHRRVIHSSIIDQVKGRADYVIIGGDLLEKGVPLKRVKENLQKLNEVAPIYFVWGNNDYEIETDQLQTIFEELHVKVLKNSAVILQSSESESIALLGIDDISASTPRLDLALEAGQGSTFRILVSHNPSIVHLFDKEANISLVLSGHTHGGQIHLFGYSPYERGAIHFMDHTTLLISNGYGTTGVPLRLGAKPETQLLTISQ